MLNFILQRLSVAAAVLFTVALIAFSLLHLSGDLAATIAGPEASAETIEHVRRQHGLDRPMTTQFFDWLASAVRLDFGRSFYFESNVKDLVAQRMPITLSLGVVSLLLALVVAVPLGVFAAIFRNGPIDRLSMFISVIGQAMPNFWFALVLILIFAVELKWLPVAGNASWKNYVLPAVALSYHAMPALMRLTRSGMLDVFAADYIRTARAKGLSAFQVVVKHALRNAIIPVVALAAVELGFMLGGSIVIETIFSLQGLGQLALDSIARDDFPVVQAIVLIIAVFYIGLSLFGDILSVLADPRLRKHG